MSTILLVKIGLAVAAALGFTWFYLQMRARDAGKRSQMLDVFADELAGSQAGMSPWGYETLDGMFEGRHLHLSLLPDALITRTLPTLWLEATWDVPQEGWLCAVLAANGMEYFADEVDEGTRIPAPQGWPEGAVLRGKDERSRVLARRLSDLDLASYRDLKMVLLTGSGIRLVLRSARADVTRYRVLRAADFPEDAVRPELATETFRALRAIRGALAETEEVA